MSLKYPQTSSFQTTVSLLVTLQFTTASNVTYPQTSSFPTTQSEDLLPFSSPLPPKLQCHLPTDIFLSLVSDHSLTACYPSIHHCLQCHLPTVIILSDHSLTTCYPSIHHCLQCHNVTYPQTSSFQTTQSDNLLPFNSPLPLMSLTHRHHPFRPYSLTTCYPSIHHCL